MIFYQNRALEVSTFYGDQGQKVLFREIHKEHGLLINLGNSKMCQNRIKGNNLTN